MLGAIIRQSKCEKTIADMWQWMAIAAKASSKKPYKIIDFSQEHHFDWETYLKQFYVRRSKGLDDVKVLLSGAVWRSFGCSPDLVMQEDGTSRVEMVEHPGEVWIRYSHDATEPWTKLDLRRYCKKADAYKYGRDKDGTISNTATQVSTSNGIVPCTDSFIAHRTYQKLLRLHPDWQ